MRVADPNSPGNSPPTKTAAAQAAARPLDDSATGPVTEGADQAELSSLSEMLQADSNSRAERVQQLKETVASGAYTVDAAAVSCAMVNETISAGSDTGIEKK